MSETGTSDELDLGVNGGLRRLWESLDGEGGLIADLLVPADDPRCGQEPSAVAQLAAAGPRAEGRRGQYELLVDTIYEGYLLHYHSPRVVCPPEADLAVLAGDRLYALGLARLVALGDVDAVAELADVISLSALAHGADEPDLARAIWTVGAHAIGWGPDPRHERAKALIRAGDPHAPASIRALVDGAASG